MKTKSPSQLLALAEIREGLEKGSMEKKYQELRHEIDALPATNYPTKRLRFIYRPKQVLFDMSKLKFK